MKTEDKLKVLIGIMASSKYRVWWWTNYQTKAAQAEFSRLWSPVLAKLTAYEIRKGMEQWQAEHVEDCPPSPELFAEFMRPKHSAMSRTGFAGLRAALNK